jgi:regulator of cell morphogenesis and NO signaling
MSHLTLETTVGQWVAHQPNASRVFEALQIDYCCGGNKPLRQACVERHLDPRQVLDQIESAKSENGAKPPEHWSDASLTTLCDHIEQTHHAYLKTELPRLQAMIAKVVSAHGAKHPAMGEVEQAFAALVAELVPHMFKEERILFPAIRRLEQAVVTPAFPFGSVGNPIRTMEYEHDQAGDALVRIRRATMDYLVPDDACNTYRAMLDGLRQLELDMHQHVHKENNILFPRAIELEQARARV